MKNILKKQKMDKLILVCYINIGNLPQEDIEDYMNRVVDTMKGEDDGIQHYFLPIQGEARIECINPRLVGDEEYKKINKKLEVLEKRLNELTETNK